MNKLIIDEFTNIPDRRRRYYLRHKEECKRRTAKWQKENYRSNQFEYVGRTKK